VDFKYQNKDYTLTDLIQM